MVDSLKHELSVLLSPRHGLIICTMMSALLLTGALLFEYVGGMPPCTLCIWQRWVHATVILGALSGLILLPRRTALILTAGLALISTVIASYHAGVEWKFWPGPAACTNSIASGSSSADMVEALLATPVVRCDDVPWSLFGLSMAGWNALLSLDIFGIATLSFIFGDRFRRHA